MRRLLLIVSLLLTCNIATAALGHYTPPRVVPVPMVRSRLEVSGHYYRASVGGLKDYMSDLRLSDPDLARQLEGDLRALRARRGAGIAVMTVGGATGLGLVLGGMFRMVAASDDCFGTEWGSAAKAACESRRDRRTHDSLNLMWIGIGVLVASEIIGLALLPYRGALLRFLNKHNSLAPGRTLRLQLGFNPQRGAAFVGLRWSLGGST